MPNLEDSWNLDHHDMYKVWQDVTKYACYYDDLCVQPQVVRTTNKKRFDESLRTLHELCRWGAKEGLGLLRGIHRVSLRLPSQHSMSCLQYFSRDLTTLHIEHRDAACIGDTIRPNFWSTRVFIFCLAEPSPGLLTIGRSVQLNFLSGAGM
jgi:hypothetical protein